MSNSSPVITGMGCLCAAGAGVETAWNNMLAGITTPCLPTKFSADIKRVSPVFEVVDGEWAETSISIRENNNTTSCVRFFLAAVAEALAQVSLSAADLRGKRVGVCAGTTVGCTLNDESFYRDYKNGLQPSLAAIERFLGNNPALYLAEALDLRGPVCTIDNACSSGTDAIGQAAEWIGDGLCDMVIAGGTDELSRIPYLGFSSLMNTSTQPCRPFDARRDGLNLGEGAGVLILESRAAARKRGVDALVGIAGYGVCADAYHPTAPHPQGVGLERAVRRALGGVDPREISLINAHGTATVPNDKIEGSTIVRIFGKDVPVFSTKSYTGHTLGAAGALEAVFAVKGLISGRIPATAGFAEPDPECEIIPTIEVTKVQGKYALSTSLAFGGINSVVLLEAVKDEG